MVEYGGERQIAVDCRRLRQSRGRSLVAKSVETGRRVQGVTEVSRNTLGLSLSLSLNFYLRDRNINPLFTSIAIYLLLL